MAAGKKNAARLGAHLAFLDESGFALTPSVRRTWAPRGQTPLVRAWARRDKLSVISALTVSPRRQRVNLYFDVHPKNLQHAEVCAFLRQLLRQLPGPVIVLWDNGRIHKGEPLRALCRAFPRLRLEAFPTYAPELNPDEGVWTATKRTLANGRPDEVVELATHLLDALDALRRSPANLRACITHSELPHFLR